MKIDKTTLYTLTQDEIKEACYSLLVQKFQGLGINVCFGTGDIKINGYSDIDGILTDVWAELKITETNEA